MKFWTKYKIILGLGAACVISANAHSQAITIDFQNKSVSADGLSWTFDLAAKGSTIANAIYQGPDDDNWQAMNIRMDLELPAGVTIVGGSGTGNPGTTTGQVGVQLDVAGSPSQGKTELGLTLARSAPPGQPGQPDININDFTTLATFTINFSGQVFQSTKVYPRLALSKEGSSWTNVADSKRRPIYFGGFAGSTMGTITLPVKLVNFNARKEKGATLLTWATSEEINADYFEVQKSADGKSWNTISKLGAQGAEKQTTQYSAIDKTPLAGTNLYRLHMVDLDGSDAYSAIQSVIFDITSTAVYPNPVQGILNIKSPQNTAVKSIEIINSQGRVVYRGSADKATSVNTNSYHPGKYIVTVLLDDGTTSKHEIVVAQ